MQDILSVTQLNERIRQLLEGEFGLLWVEGEISNLRRPASGHMYFTLKDDKSQIRAVMFRYPAAALGKKTFELEDGLRIVCRSRLGVYQPRGEYQLIVDYVEPLGIGALQRAFEQLKARLSAEGLFDPARKKRIPFIPGKIGVITSPSGAVIRDILHVSRRRFPSIDILIVPVRVQGPESPGEIVRALEDMQNAGGVDVIILARGGGSLEDLAPFNDEGVARAIARCRIPVISAVGHETDYTIADFVADQRAPTPSAAAEMAVPVKEDLFIRMNALFVRLIDAERRTLRGLREWQGELAGRLRDPRRLIADWRVAVDDHLVRLQAGANRQGISRRQRLEQLAGRLAGVHPALKVRQERTMLGHWSDGLIKAWNQQYLRLKSRLQKESALLDSLSPLAILKRGYSITRRTSDGKIVKDAADVTAGAGLHIKLSSGALEAEVLRIDRES
jgi:exodeoxyribonuclease VII large subunit